MTIRDRAVPNGAYVPAHCGIAAGDSWILIEQRREPGGGDNRETRRSAAIAGGKFPNVTAPR